MGIAARLAKKPEEKANFVKFVVLAAIILFMVMGGRQTTGLFVLPIIAKTKMSIADVSLALAISQLVWGIFQPLWGAVADRGKTFPVLLAGLLCLAAGQIGTIFAHTPFFLILFFGLLSPIGAAAASLPILIGSASSRLTSEKRSVASGIINIGGAAGQFTFAPLLQHIINLRGYAASLLLLAGTAFAAIIPSRLLYGKKEAAGSANQGPVQAQGSPGALSVREQLKIALRNPSYLMLHFSFFVCGFHVTFLSTHLPGEINLYGYAATVTAICISIIGLCNIMGSIGSGIIGKYIQMKYILVFLYASRSLCIALSLVTPKTPLSFYIYAAIFGITWSATVPPTSGLVGKIFKGRYLATLFGLVVLSHQVGAFFGAWLGGIILQKTGTFFGMWCIAMVLAAFASLISLPIKESSLSVKLEED